MGGLQIPRWLGSDPLSAWWLGLAPATLEFWARFPNERNQGKQALPVLKYRVPHGSQCVMSRLIHTGLGSVRLVVSHNTCPLLSSPPREQLCNRSCSNKTHTQGEYLLNTLPGQVLELQLDLHFPASTTSPPRCTGNFWDILQSIRFPPQLVPAGRYNFQ